MKGEGKMGWAPTFFITVYTYAQWRSVRVGAASSSAKFGVKAYNYWKAQNLKNNK